MVAAATSRGGLEGLLHDPQLSPLLGGSGRCGSARGRADTALGADQGSGTTLGGAWGGAGASEPGMGVGGVHRPFMAVVVEVLAVGR